MSAELPPAGETRIPLHVEELSVSRRQTGGDTLQVSTVTREHERFVDEMLNHERVEIKEYRLAARSMQCRPFDRRAIRPSCQWWKKPSSSNVTFF